MYNKNDSLTREYIQNEIKVTLDLVYLLTGENETRFDIDKWTYDHNGNVFLNEKFIVNDFRIVEHLKNIEHLEAILKRLEGGDNDGTL
ncbi:hypothetical protein [Thermoflavimicrobium daqui]|uniref:Uncharacterized protein n=1 Tax=Thermoflavimicrobium daqui TaxID=2137476 RepID=A0A364K0F9_9BACL|nr:hypothetical protein [Thermoflavimicrobium daqui]RAL20834.1 hypothetical protein DL897_17705 [Thermoflavimicrobium daqui]